MYAKGYDNVITIGNDTPHLKTSQLLKAAKMVEKNAMVLGPSRDGGYYLLGIHKSQFNADLFLKLPWQTSQITHKIERLLTSNKIKVVRLRQLEDIDSALDAKRIFDGFQKLSEAVLKVLRAIFSSEILILKTTAVYCSSFQQQIFYNKGSPLSCS